MYYLTNELHVVAAVLELSFGRCQEYERKEIRLFVYCSEISKLCYLIVYNVRNKYITMNKVVGFKMSVYKTLSSLYCCSRALINLH
jgi:hypothetical protein